MMLLFVGIILYQLIVAIHPKLIMVVDPKVLFRGGKSTEQTTGETTHVESVEPPTSTTVEPLARPVLVVCHWIKKHIPFRHLGTSRIYKRTIANKCGCSKVYFLYIQ